MSGQFPNRDAWADLAGRQALDKVRGDLDREFPKPKASPREEEHQTQAAFIEWVRLVENQIRELAALYAIPNGGWRHPAVAGKLKAEGVVAGVPDLCLPVPRDPWAALYLETKSAEGTLSNAQVERARILRWHGNAVIVCRTFEQLRAATLAYLERRLPPVWPGNGAVEAAHLGLVG